LARTHRFATIHEAKNGHLGGRSGKTGSRNMAATQYAHGLLLESLFGPSIADCWAVRAKNKAKTAVWVAVAAKPEVEIWRRPKKSIL